MKILCCCIVSLSVLTGCGYGSQADTHIVVDYGDFASFGETANCENTVNWFDKHTLDDAQCTQAFAAEELQKYLRRMGADSGQFKVVKPSSMVSNGNKIIIASMGHLNAYRSQGLDAHIAGLGLKPQGYLIKSFSRGGNTHLLIVGADRVGTLYGVYDFLETLGVRWYGPGEENEELPDISSLHIPVINKVDHPAFITRGFWAKDDRGHSDFFDWMARNRINLWSYAQPERGALKKRGINFLTGGHQIQQRFLHPHSEYPYQHKAFSSHAHTAVDPYPQSSQFRGDVNNDGVLTYREAHPEWYGLINGKRNFDVEFKYGTNFCTSNQHAVTELSRNFIADLVGGKWSQADMINFWPSDVGKWCECAQCQALGTPTDRMLLLLHQVRQNIDEAIDEGRLDRNIMLAAPAYLETRQAPTRPLPEDFDYAHNIVTFFPIERCYAHAFNDPSCTDINHHHNADMRHWMIGEQRHYQGTMFLGEYYNISLLASLPIMFTQVMSQDLPYYYRSGIRHMHYMHAETVNWGSMLLTNYQFAKMLWNPDVNVAALLDELYQKYYGIQAARLMQQFYYHLERGMSSMKTIRWAGKSLTESYSLDARLKQDNPLLFTSPHLQYAAHKSNDNDGRDILEMVDDMRRARKLIDRALALLLDSKYSQRIKQVEKRFAYGEAMVYFYDYLIQTHQAHHADNKQVARAAFRQAAMYADKLKAMTDVIQVVGGTLKAGDGFTATFNTQTYERYRQLYGAP